MISPREIQELHDRPTEELRELAAHVAGVLAHREDLGEAAAVYHRIGDRLDSMRRSAMT